MKTRTYLSRIVRNLAYTVTVNTRRWLWRHQTERAVQELFDFRGGSLNAERALIEHALGRRFYPKWLKDFAKSQIYGTPAYHQPTRGADQKGG